MNKKLNKVFVVLSSLTIFSCAKNVEVNNFKIDDLELYVYDQNNDLKIHDISKIDGISYSFEGNNIRIEDNKVIALKSNTETTVKAKYENLETSFKVKVLNREYASNHKEAEEKEGWFDEIDVKKIEGLRKEFAKGMDISSVKNLYDNGAKFYNSDGIEQSIFQILKEKGVNYIRVRLWNEPYDYLDENKQTLFKYGGGNCDLNNALWITKEAKEAGLSVFLDFHYSDFWADQGNQVVPKMWKDIKTNVEMKEAIYNYTFETLNIFKEKNILLDVVSIGNEISNGILTKNPGGITDKPSGDNPLYIKNATTKKDGVEGSYDYTTNKETNKNFLMYINAGLDAVKDVSKDIKTAIHYAGNLEYYDYINKFFGIFDSENLDILGLSAYSFYHFSNMEILKNSLESISKTYKNKQIMIAETSYGFTYEEDQFANNSFYSSGDTKPIENYPCSINGQAQILRDTIEAISSIENGFGLFYWEGAWIPKEKCGWGDELSKASWANQALFSYDGKALGSLDVFNKI